MIASILRECDSASDSINTMLGYIQAKDGPHPHPPCEECRFVAVCKVTQANKASCPKFQLRVIP